MRLRNIPRADGDIAESLWVVKEPDTRRGNWNSLFPVSQPLFLEIGTGKGQFIIACAQQHPEINFIGMEKYSSILLRLLDKQKALELPNLLLLRGDAEEVENYFAAEEISRLYLNFSDPWPKDRHAKRRLPSRQFLARYDNILTADGTIEFKTDNRSLFDFAVEEVSESAFRIRSLTYDLHHDPVMNDGNILTEYEEKFSAKGNPICKYILDRKASHV